MLSSSAVHNAVSEQVGEDIADLVIKNAEVYSRGFDSIKYGEGFEYKLTSADIEAAINLYKMLKYSELEPSSIPMLLFTRQDGTWEFTVEERGGFSVLSSRATSESLVQAIALLKVDWQ